MTEHPPAAFDWLLALLAPVLATVLSLLLSQVMPGGHFSMIYLAAVLLVAVRIRVKPALASALLSFLAYNFFFTEPRFSLLMNHREDVLTVSLLILVAAVTGHLAARLHEKVMAVEAGDRWNREQIALAQALNSCSDGSEVVGALSHHIRQCFSLETQVYLRAKPGGKWLSQDDANSSDELVLNIPDRATDEATAVLLMLAGEAVVACYRDGEPQAVVRIGAPARIPAQLSGYLTGFVQLTNLAWRRTQVEVSLRKETLEKEREQLRSALLSSISHDLKTPLATMIGSVSSLISLQNSLSEAQQQELLSNTLSEAQRLESYIQKLLDMTRLGYGELKLDRDWVGIDDILSVVVKRIKPLLRGLDLRLDIPPDLPLLYVHAALIEQAIFNVLENAVRVSPQNSAIDIRVSCEEDFMLIDIIDQGEGVPEDAWESIFDRFYSSNSDGNPSGSGLGLPICRGIMGAHGGSAKVLESLPHQGTTMRLCLPLDLTAGRQEITEHDENSSH